LTELVDIGPCHRFKYAATDISFADVHDCFTWTEISNIEDLGFYEKGQGWLRELLWNRARSFVFSTAPSPVLAELARFHVQRTRGADELRAILERRASELRAALAARGFASMPGSFGPIVPVLIGDERRALATVEILASEGVVAQAIRPPTVPKGTARLRLTAKASWADGVPALIAEALAKALCP
jgi:7-keto-8-aminopelargonate synthetase-like enzyme